MRQNVYSLDIITRESTSLQSNLDGQGHPLSSVLGNRKLETLCYPTVKTAPLCVPSFWHSTRVWLTDGQTDTQIYCSIYSACKAIFAACRKQRTNMLSAVVLQKLINS